MKFIALLHLLLFVWTMGNAQTISGKVCDIQNESVPNAVLILQNADSSFISATTTDSLGFFNLKININDGFVIVQHLAYENKTIAFTNGDFTLLKNIALTEKSNLLDGVTIEAKTPAVVLHDNALVYNAQLIANKKVASNAFELLKYTPGIIIRNDVIDLAGSSALTVIIDGKVTTLGNSEICEILKSMPPNRVTNIEVMYKAPAKYGVQGAVINIVTDKKRHDTPFEAELCSEFIQQFYSYGIQKANIAYRGDKLDVDVLASMARGKDRGESEDYSINTYNGQSTIIRQNTNIKSKIKNLRFRTSADYNFNNGNKISLLYYTSGSNSDNDMNSTTNFLYHNGTEELIYSTNDKYNKGRMHNVNLKGVFGAFELTADYVSYSNEEKTEYEDQKNEKLTADYQNNSAMDNDQLMLLANYNWRFNDKWEISVGTNGTLTSSATEISYFFPQNGIYHFDNDTYSENVKKERRFSAFTESFNTIFDSIQLNFTLKLDYFKSDYDQNGTKSTLWNEWHIYPSFSVIWPIKRDIIQLSLENYNVYPSYWQLSPHTTQLNPYTFLIGNPEIKPATNYILSLNYIIHQQHTVTAYCFYGKNAYFELPYQKAEECRIYYQTVNYDYGLIGGIGGDFPFYIDFWEPTLSAYLVYQRHKKSDFHGIPFLKEKCVLSLDMYNTFTISKEKPDLKLMLNCSYHTKAIEGLFDVNYGLNAEIGLKWRIRKNLIFTAEWSDIFEKSSGHPYIVDFNGQYNKIIDRDFNIFRASLVWNIGEFNAKDVEITDTERMQR